MMHCYFRKKTNKAVNMTRLGLQGQLEIALRDGPTDGQTDRPTDL